MADDADTTAEILSQIPGGAEVLAWFGGTPNFGDAEVISLTLDRLGPSQLRILAMTWRGEGRERRYEEAIVTFTLADMIDVAIEGFAHRNVIDGLAIRAATAKDVHPTLIGIGLNDADHEIELRPCAGAFGTIRASITGVSIAPPPARDPWPDG